MGAAEVVGYKATAIPLLVVSFFPQNSLTLFSSQKTSLAHPKALILSIQTTFTTMLLLHLKLFTPKLAFGRRAFSLSSKYLEGARVMVSFANENFPTKDKVRVIKSVTAAASGDYQMTDRAEVKYV